MGVIADKSDSISHWSVMVQFFDVEKEGEVLAYLVYIAWENAPRCLRIGSQILLQRGRDYALGEVFDVIDDPLLRSRIASWSTKE